MKAVLCGKKVLDSLRSDETSADETNLDFAIIRPALGDSPRTFIQGCGTAKDAWAILNKRYATESSVNKLSVPNSMVSMRLRQGDGMDYHISMMEKKFSKLVAMKKAVSESMKVPILIISSSNSKDYTAISS